MRCFLEVGPSSATDVLAGWLLAAAALPSSRGPVAPLAAEPELDAGVGSESGAAAVAATRLRFGISTWKEVRKRVEGAKSGFSRWKQYGN